MLCVGFSRLCMSCLSLCDFFLCYSILGSQFSNKYLLTYFWNAITQASEVLFALNEVHGEILELTVSEF